MQPDQQPTTAAPLWTIYAPDGKRCTVATFYTQEQAERQIAEWQDRQRRGKRPDVDATGLYADVVKGTAATMAPSRSMRGTLNVKRPPTASTAEGGLTEHRLGR